MLPYGRQSIADEDVEAVAAVLRGDWLTTGPAVAAFEAALSAQAGGHPTLAVSSGTAALHVAYAAAGIRTGSEVVATPMTFVATTSTASVLGAHIVFADVEPDTGLIDPAAVAAVASERTAVIAAVDYAGHPAAYRELGSIAARVGALVLDDAAHSIGGFYNSRPVGDLADLTIYSFFPTKNLTTAEGGAVVAKDVRLFEAARDFRGIGMVRDPSRFKIVDEGPWHQEVQEFGLNYRLSDVSAALGLSQLRRLEQFKTRRAQIVDRYSAALGTVDGLAVPVRREGVDPAWHLYPLRVLEGRRRAVFERLRERGVGVQVNYIPVYWHPVYADMGYRRGMCPRAERYYSEEISLPLWPDLTDSQVDWVIDEVVGALR